MHLDWRRAWRTLTATHRREAALVALGVAIGYWALRLGVPRVAGAFPDDAAYLALGKAIASGAGYHSIYAAGEPVHLKYPPGLPLIFAALWWLGRTLPAVTGLAVTLSTLVSATAAGTIWWIGRAKVGLHPWITLIWAVGPFLLDGAILYFSLPISEPYFVLGWATALAAFYRFRDRPAAGSAAGLGLLVAATVLVRTQAVAIGLGLLLAMAIERAPWRPVVGFLGATLLPLVAWGWYHARLVAAGPVSTQPDEASYFSWLPIHRATDVVPFVRSSVRVNWDTYWDWFARYVSDVRAVGIALLALFLVLALAGAALLARRQSALVWTTVASAGVVMVWPWPQDRFVFSCLPFAGLLVATAVQAGLQRAAPRVRLAGHLTLGALAVAITARQMAFRPFAYLPVSPRVVFGIPYPGHFLAANTRFILVASRWLLDHTTPQDRILVDAPAAIYLYTGRHAVSALPAQSELLPSWFEPPGRYLASRVLADGVTVIVMTDIRHPIARDIATFYQRCPGVLQYVGNADWWTAASQAFFYRVTKPDGCVREKILAG